MPCPRPGELLIYDCRPLPASVSALDSAFGRDISRLTRSPSSSPPTPTPDQKTATFPSQRQRQAQTTSTEHINESPQGSLLLQNEGLDNAAATAAASAAVAAAAAPVTNNNFEQGAVHGNESSGRKGQREDSGTRSSGDLTGTSARANVRGWAQNDGAHATGSHGSQRPIRCLQWNIERNYKPEEILATLTQLDADILCIQEIDIGCRRSGYDRDHFLEICQSQGLYGGFVPEFWELEHPDRKDRDQGGGVHGNAILSKWPVNGFRVLDHVHHAYEWERDGLKLKEPRLGRRFTIVADIQTPSGPLLCYSAHLEVFTGIVGRISALSDILADSELYSDRYPYQILFGDLNTISHSIARLAKSISTDQYRVASFGEQEAEWWDRNLWSWHVQDGEFNLALASGGWSWLRQLGVLGFGAGRHRERHLNEGPTTAWTADTRYTRWLKKRAGSGLEKVKQARQLQLQTDKFISLEQKQPLHHHDNDQVEDEEDGTSFDHDLASEKSYQEDGSMILVGRPKSPSIITLDSTLMDRSGSDSTCTWSSPSMTFSHQYGSSDDEEYEQQRGRKMKRDNTKPSAPRTPSTPSPTLRLIPPTPTKSRGSGLPDLTEQERGIPLECDDDHMYDDDDDDYGTYPSSFEHHHHHHYHHSALEDNDHHERINDHSVMTTTKTTTTTMRRSHIAATTTTTTTTTTIQDKMNVDIDGDDSFQEPLPPFLLSDLKLSHPFLATQRLWSGFTPLVLHQARNPGFYDPWTTGGDMTFHNPNFFGLLKAKLDFTLLMNLKCVGKSMGNHDYSASDHKWLLMEVEFERDFETTNTNTNAAAVATSQQDDHEAYKGEKDGAVELPSKEQRYHWWRERRMEARQDVQTLRHSKNQGIDGDGTRGRSRKQSRKHKRRDASSSSPWSSSSSTSYFTAATLTAIVAIGGAVWWSLRK